MKKYALPLALASVVTLQACNQEAPAPQNTVAAEPAALSLDTTEQRLSYGIAYGLGQRMAADGIPLDGDAFSAGIRDALDGAEPKTEPGGDRRRDAGLPGKGRSRATGCPGCCWVKPILPRQRPSLQRTRPGTV